MVHCFTITLTYDDSTTTRGSISVDHKAPKVIPEYFKSDYRVASNVLDPQADIDTLQSFVVKKGQPGVLPNSKN